MDNWQRCFFPAYNHRGCRQSISPPEFADDILGVDRFGCNYSASAGLEFIGERADCYCIWALGAFVYPILFDPVITVGRIPRMMPPNHAPQRAERWRWRSCRCAVSGMGKEFS